MSWEIISGIVVSIIGLVGWGVYYQKFKDFFKVVKEAINEIIVSLEDDKITKEESLRIAEKFRAILGVFKKEK